MEPGDRAIDSEELQDLGWTGIALLIHVSTQKPGLVFEPASIDLGSVPKGTEKAFRLKVTNRGSEEVKIAKIDAGCGCIRVGVTNPTIGPGESVVLAGVFRAGEPGKVRRQVRIFTLTPSKAVLPVEMVGEVITTILASRSRGAST